MPLAVTHVLITIVLVDLYRHYIAKNSFSRVYVLIAGIAGLLPDADIPLNWLTNPFLNLDIHGIFTHSVIWGALFILIGALIYFSRKKKYFSFTKKQVSLFFIMIGIGWFSHVFLDCTFAGGGNIENVTWFPFNPIKFCPRFLNQTYLAGLDAFILLFWLIHEEVKHKIKDYF